ncbi:hypothetical protein RFI_35768 [Reticulomyxa filosa]|uniref:Uncharacterized protein n=1 Tax=Reticulomyxa filosa TaxID=46433 RepID=X6LKK1_RETFI|nr:hypothetical protein RFI_35768 [Reticulomyxa filosa]|eukprot:ETO01672.1 hypothetical protein RFI_35768 [Reticulomyxa filosa]
MSSLPSKANNKRNNNLKDPKSIGEQSDITNQINSVGQSYYHSRSKAPYLNIDDEIIIDNASKRRQLVEIKPQYRNSLKLSRPQDDDCENEYERTNKKQKTKNKK